MHRLVDDDKPALPLQRPTEHDLFGGKVALVEAAYRVERFVNGL